MDRLDALLGFVAGYTIRLIQNEIQRRREEWQTGRTMIDTAVQMQAEAGKRYKQGRRHTIKWGFLWVLGYVILLGLIVAVALRML